MQRLKFSTLAPKIKFSDAQKQVMEMPSQYTSRLSVFTQNVLLEDLMIMTYDHRYANPESQYRKQIQKQNEAENQTFMQHMKALTEVKEEKKQLKPNWTAQQAKMRQKNEQNAQSRAFAPLHKEKKKVQQDQSYLQLLDPVPVKEQIQHIDEHLPKLFGISLRMLMPQAISHSKKILLNGLLALQLITGQQAQILLSDASNSQLKVRKGMPIGVQSQIWLEDPLQSGDEKLFRFLEKFVDIVLPKCRDFQGFSKHLGKHDEPLSTLTLQMDAETWQHFPEIGASYLKFPQLGSVGSLQPFEITFHIADAKNEEQVRLLLSGYKIPFTFLSKVEQKEEKEEEEFIHDV